jgi:TRAP-type transport system periplasmic protein
MIGNRFQNIALAILALLPGLAAAQQTLRFAHSTAPDSPYGTAVEAFGSELTRLTGILNKVKAGDFELGSTSTGPLGNLVPESKILDLPFLFTSYAHARNTLDGPIGQTILDSFPKYGLRGLAWTENGFRHISNNKRAIVFPEDLAALKIRTMENSVHMGTMRLMKAVPTPLPFPKLYQTLKDGDLDGQENPLPIILSGKLYETQRYLSLTQHFYSAAVVTISPKLWDQLSSDDKLAFVAAAKAGAKAQRYRVNVDDAQSLVKLTDLGMKINAHVDSQSFKTLLRDKYDQFLPGVNMSLVKAIRETK